MSLTYDCLFAGPSPDLHVLLDQLVDEHLDETPENTAGDDVFCFFENNGSFSLYYVDDDDVDSKPMLLIYPSTRPQTYTLAFGEFHVASNWYIDTNHTRNMAKADEALARLLRLVLKQYAGDFACLFNGEQVMLHRAAGRVYLNSESDISEEPSLSLLQLPDYELKTYNTV